MCVCLLVGEILTTFVNSNGLITKQIYYLKELVIFYDFWVTHSCKGIFCWIFIFPYKSYSLI